MNEFLNGLIVGSLFLACIEFHHQDFLKFKRDLDHIVYLSKEIGRLKGREE